MMRILLHIIGTIAVMLGFIGIFLPVMPTVPFLLIAAWAFARSSPKLQQKILNHPTYGPHVREWQERGAVSRIAKIWAIATMSFGVGVSLWLGLDYRIVFVQAAICAAIAIFLITRPETR